MRITPDLKFIQTSILEIAYEHEGQRGGRAVMLLHGWPSIRPASGIRPSWSMMRRPAASLPPIASYGKNAERRTSTMIFLAPTRSLGLQCAYQHGLPGIYAASPLLLLKRSSLKKLRSAALLR